MIPGCSSRERALIWSNGDQLHYGVPGRLVEILASQPYKILTSESSSSDLGVRIDYSVELAIMHEANLPRLLTITRVVRLKRASRSKQQFIFD